ncbi:hypothetical protein QN277_013812 [Acacia crassicarpa]|uniref:Uncharacterized protein n=1 Tax=Acacia crassicarpa TaxID=499986 RepID=A0AAE1N3F0_9FABA|nr:hypothetical protein QN277_013812 [Acacia crassicarpa]
MKRKVEDTMEEALGSGETTKGLAEEEESFASALFSVEKGVEEEETAVNVGKEGTRGDVYDGVGGLHLTVEMATITEVGVDYHLSIFISSSSHCVLVNCGASSSSS